MKRSEQPTLFMGPFDPRFTTMDPDVMCRWLRWLTDQLYPVDEPAGEVEA